MDKGFKKFSEFFKKTDKKLKYNIIAVLAIGVVLLVLSKGLSDKGNEENKETIVENESANTKENTISYERELEERLKRALSKVEGVGDVEVVITLSYKNEIELAEDVTTDISQTVDDSESLKKSSVTESSQNKKLVISQKDGSNVPIVIKEYEPKIEGAVVIAKGGDNPYVKSSITKAAQALLNVPAHKIEVLKMK